jgi:hypothetical protein
MLTAACRCASLSAIPRANALAIIRQASSSHSKQNKDEPAAVSVEDPSRSPMSERPLPPDDGKVRMYSINPNLCRISLWYFTGFPNPWDIILNKRRFEYAMVWEDFE